MKKVIVIGCPGAGKSTFARQLRDCTGLPLFYLDMIWHKEDRTNITREEFDSELNHIMEQDEWIIDGNYLRTLETRCKKCDTIFFLDYPLEICIAGAESRIGQKREDMPWVEEEFDPEFRTWIEEFPEKQLPVIYRLLETYKENCDIYILKSREDGENVLSLLL